MSKSSFLMGQFHAAEHEHCPCFCMLVIWWELSRLEAAEFEMGHRFVKQANGEPFLIQHYGCCHPSSDRNVPPNQVPELTQMVERSRASVRNPAGGAETLPSKKYCGAHNRMNKILQPVV